MRRKKLYSKFLCIGFLWGIISWILIYNRFVKETFSIYTMPVFISLSIQNNFNASNIHDSIKMTSFLISIAAGGLIGYLIAHLIELIVGTTK